MRLPAEPSARRQFVVDVARQCTTDRTSRRAYHRELREWYTRGTVTGDRAIFNQIKSVIQQAGAYRYASESTRFSCSVDDRYGDQFTVETEVVTDWFNKRWRQEKHGLPMVVGSVFAQVYPSLIFKVVPSRGRPLVTLVQDPSDVGVWEPDKPFDLQEAITHMYTLSLPAFDRMIAGHPHEEVLREVARSRAEVGHGNDPLGGTIERMIFDQVAPDGSPVYGGGSLIDGRIIPDALVDAPRVTCCELWVVDDDLQDWRVVTCLAPQGEISTVIWSRRTPILSGVDPFVDLCLDPAMDYTWGFAAIDDMAGLQDLSEERLRDINELMKLQLFPPTVLGGFGGLSDERAQRMNTPRGVLTTSIPNPNIQRLAPQFPPEGFTSLQEMKRWFADVTGLPAIANPGGGDMPGIRAGDQLGQLATLTSALLRRQSMAVEEATAEIATLVVRMERDLYPHPLRKPDGSRFYLKDVPRDLAATVDAHSSSPLFAAAIRADADLMKKLGVISDPAYVRLKNPPGVDRLIAEARKISEAKAQQAERLFRLKELQVRTKGRR